MEKGTTHFPTTLTNHTSHFSHFIRKTAQYTPCLGCLPRSPSRNVGMIRSFNYLLAFLLGNSASLVPQDQAHVQWVTFSVVGNTTGGTTLRTGCKCRIMESVLYVVVKSNYFAITSTVGAKEPKRFEFIFWKHENSIRLRIFRHFKLKHFKQYNKKGLFRVTMYEISFFNLILLSFIYYSIHTPCSRQRRPKRHLVLFHRKIKDSCGACCGCGVGKGTPSFCGIASMRLSRVIKASTDTQHPVPMI